jgi:hypothetical protein
LLRGWRTGIQVPAVEELANQSTLSQLSTAAEIAADGDVPHYLLGRYFDAHSALDFLPSCFQLISFLKHLHVGVGRLWIEV